MDYNKIVNEKVTCGKLYNKNGDVIMDNVMYVNEAPDFGNIISVKYCHIDLREDGIDEVTNYIACAQYYSDSCEQLVPLEITGVTLEETIEKVYDFITGNYGVPNNNNYIGYIIEN